ncbi:MAG: hypothetical protein PHY92_06495 [Alphaproteobacteria bacterium]|nr:hypothetical protein [Alphaproteobacteria bacterium]
MDIVETAIKVTPWVILGGLGIRELWKIGSRRYGSSDKPVEPFKGIKNVDLPKSEPK